MQTDLYLLSGPRVAFGYCGEIISSLLIAVFRDMPSFHPPVYSKQHDAKKNTVEPCYTFSIDFQDAESGLIFTADSASDITNTTIESLITEHMDWWKQLLAQLPRNLTRWCTHLGQFGWPQSMPPIPQLAVFVARASRQGRRWL